MRAFWILWVFNALMAAVPVYFFLDGLSDGSVNNDNIGIWMIMLFVIVLLLGGTMWLKNKNQLVVARVILIITAIPSILAILFLAIVIGSDTRWN